MQANVLDEGPASDMPQRSAFGKPQKPKAPAKAGSATWLVAALLVLSAFPLAFGVFRLTQLAGGAEITPANARFFASPLPIVLHIVSAGVYAVLGALQFAPGFRRRRPGWHRAAGRLLVACGLLVGLSGLWMTLFYPGADGTGELLYALRLLFGSAMVVSIVLGVTTSPRLKRLPPGGVPTMRMPSQSLNQSHGSAFKSKSGKPCTSLRDHRGLWRQQNCCWVLG